MCNLLFYFHFIGGWLLLSLSFFMYDMLFSATAAAVASAVPGWFWCEFWFLSYLTPRACTFAFAFSVSSSSPILLFFPSLPFGFWFLLRLFISGLPRALSLLLFSLQKKCWKGGEGQGGVISEKLLVLFLISSLLLNRSSFPFSCSLKRILFFVILSLCPLPSLEISYRSLYPHGLLPSIPFLFSLAPYFSFFPGLFLFEYVLVKADTIIAFAALPSLSFRIGHSSPSDAATTTTAAGTRFPFRIKLSLSL